MEVELLLMKPKVNEMDAPPTRVSESKNKMKEWEIGKSQQVPKVPNPVENGENTLCVAAENWAQPQKIGLLMHFNFLFMSNVLQVFSFFGRLYGRFQCIIIVKGIHRGKKTC